MRLIDCCPDAAAPARADLRRQRLIDAARTLFEDQGFHATGMAQIATASGIKVGQIYRDFPSKEAIVAAIVESDLTAFLDGAAMRRAVAAGDLPAVRRWITDFVCPDRDAASRLIPEICAETGRNERIAAIMDAVDRRARGDLALALTAFAPRAAGTPQIAVLVDLVMTLLIGVASQRTTAPERDLAPVCARITALIDTELTALAAAGRPLPGGELLPRHPLE